MFGGLEWLFRTNWRVLPPRSVRGATFPEVMRKAIKSKRRHKRLSLVLPRSAFIQRSIPAPQVGRSRRSQAIETTVKYSLPGDGSDFFWAVSPPEGKQVRVSILGKAYLEKLRHRLLSRNLQLISVIVDDGSGALVWEDKTRPFRGAGFWFTAASVALAAMLWLHFAPLVEERARLTSELVAQKELADELFSKAEIEAASAFEAEARRTIYAAELRSLKSDRGRTEILTQLTVLLDNETWIEELRLNGTDVRLSLNTNTDPLSIVEKLEASPLFERVRTDGSVSTDRVTGTVSVDLILNVVIRSAA